MKPIKILGTALGVVMAGLAGFMALTNPNPRDYEQYATEKLSVYLKENVCDKAEAEKSLRSLLRGSCKTLVDTSRPTIEQIITTTTTRKNFFIFSVYETELSMPFPIPSYQFSTVGICHNFYIYMADKI